MLRLAHSLFKTGSRRGSRYSRRPGVRYSSSSSAGASFSSRGPPMWMWAALSLGGFAGLYNFSMPNVLFGDKQQKKEAEVDEAKNTYWSCIGEEIELPLPEEAGIITFAPEVPPPINRSYPARVKVDMNTSLRTVPLDSTYDYEIWSFNGGAPGPLIRARVGDILDVSFTNEDETGMWHNIDFHAVTGPGGGAPVLTATKNETRTASFRLLHPGLFVYHCAVDPVGHHMANGMYGAILVEPEGGMPPVDKEFYVVQSEFYTTEEPEPGTRTLLIDEERLMDERPNYVVFNGRVGSMTAEGEPLQVNAGERFRLYFANAGPNLVSSFHVIGAIFDKVYREGDLISPPARSLQTTLVPAGGAVVAEIVAAAPGNLTLVDHSIVRIEKGAVGFINVQGPQCPRIYHSDKEPRPCSPCIIHP